MTARSLCNVKAGTVDLDSFECRIVVKATGRCARCVRRSTTSAKSEFLSIVATAEADVIN